MSELRHDPLTRRWVIVAMERARRPGEFEFAAPVPADDEPPCVFCPGMESRTPPEITAIREKGSANDANWVVRAIPNKHPVLAIEGSLDRAAAGQFDRMRGVGAHEIVIESPDHRVRPARMPLLQLAAALGMSRNRMADLMRDRRFKYVLLHRNYGAAAGATIFHPIEQIVAIPVTPARVRVQLEVARAHFQLKERCLYCDILAQELDDGSRIVHVDEQFVSFCPYPSRFPYELRIFPRRHMHQFTDLDDASIERLAAHMLVVFRRLEEVLGDVSLNWLLTNAPNPHAGVARPGYWTTLPHDFHWHLEILPRLTPMAGFEWGTGFYINPSPPEDAAAFLRDAG
jgi:UDPglucose--hexose-1-phosphate uridylyltransferase